MSLDERPTHLCEYTLAVCAGAVVSVGHMKGERNGN